MKTHLLSLLCLLSIFMFSGCDSDKRPLPAKQNTIFLPSGKKLVDIDVAHGITHILYRDRRLCEPVEQYTYIQAGDIGDESCAKIIQEQ